MTKLDLQVAHQIPGRIRMKIPSAKGNGELLRQIGETFGAIPGIEEVRVNPLTGSIVLEYDTDSHDQFHSMFRGHYREHCGEQPPATELDKVASSIEMEAEYLAKHSEAARVLVDCMKSIDREIKVATNNTVDFKIVLALGLIGLTVIEVGATAATPVWVTLAVFTLNHFIETHQRHQASPNGSAHLAPVKFQGQGPAPGAAR